MRYEEIFEQYVDSSWILSLEYDAAQQHTVMTTIRDPGKEYYFPMDEEEYNLWLEYWSKGTFYHNFLRGR